MSLHGGFDGFNDPDRGGIFGSALNNQAAGGGGPLAGNAPGGDSFFSSGNFLGKDGTASLAIGGLKTLGSIWSSFQQFKLAKSSLKFQKDAFKTNLANSTKVYNTALEDRIRARYATEGRSDQADAKIAENRL